jgi:hypothetical protein
MLLQVNDVGELVLPAEIVQAAPHTTLNAERCGDAVVLKPAVAAEPSASWLDLPSYPIGPVDSAMTFRREDLYGDNGR